MHESLPSVANVSHRFVNVNGIELHVAEAGNGPPLLMLHGWPQHWYMWRHQISALAQHYSVLCPDLRGSGWSDAPANGYLKEDLVKDVVGLLDALGIARVRLIGHDWGGWIGFLLCLHHPERVQRYLALNIPHPFQRLDRRILSLWRFAYQPIIASPVLGKRIVRSRSGFVRLLLRLGFANSGLNEADIATYTTRLDEPCRANASVELYRTFLMREMLPCLAGRYRSMRLETPTLLLFGQRDFAISRSLLSGYEPYAPHMTVEFVPESGHFIAEDQPALVSQRALEFFA